MICTGYLLTFVKKFNYKNMQNAVGKKLPKKVKEPISNWKNNIRPVPEPICKVQYKLIKLNVKYFHQCLGQYEKCNLFQLNVKYFHQCLGQYEEFNLFQLNVKYFHQCLGQYEKCKLIKLIVKYFHQCLSQYVKHKLIKLIVKYFHQCLGQYEKYNLISKSNIIRQLSPYTYIPIHVINV